MEELSKIITHKYHRSKGTAWNAMPIGVNRINKCSANERPVAQNKCLFGNFHMGLVSDVHEKTKNNSKNTTLVKTIDWATAIEYSVPE